MGRFGKNILASCSKIKNGAQDVNEMFFKKTRTHKGLVVIITGKKTKVKKIGQKFMFVFYLNLTPLVAYLFYGHKIV